MKRNRSRALILVGPTGAGKTPLGEWIERHGFRGRHAHHFDFGACLRAIATAERREEWSVGEIEFIRGVLTRGALLEDETFPLAGKILHKFVRQRRVKPDDLLVMNGLPRHVGQAAGLEPLLAVDGVVDLRADAAVIRERLAQDSGGDRAGRGDDTEAIVRRKLALYQERTQPLVEHYRQRGVAIFTVAVTPRTRPEEIAALLEGPRAK